MDSGQKMSGKYCVDCNCGRKSEPCELCRQGGMRCTGTCACCQEYRNNFQRAGTTQEAGVNVDSSVHEERLGTPNVSEQVSVSVQPSRSLPDVGVQSSFAYPKNINFGLFSRTAQPVVVDITRYIQNAHFAWITLSAAENSSLEAGPQTSSQPEGSAANLPSTISSHPTGTVGIPASSGYIIRRLPSSAEFRRFQEERLFWKINGRYQEIQRYVYLYDGYELHVVMCGLYYEKNLCRECSGAIHWTEHWKYYNGGICRCPVPVRVNEDSLRTLSVDTPISTLGSSVVKVMKTDRVLYNKEVKVVPPIGEYRRLECKPIEYIPRIRCHKCSGHDRSHIPHGEVMAFVCCICGRIALVPFITEHPTPGPAGAPLLSRAKVVDITQHIPNAHCASITLSSSERRSSLAAGLQRSNQPEEGAQNLPSTRSARPRGTKVKLCGICSGATNYIFLARPSLCERCPRRMPKVSNRIWANNVAEEIDEIRCHKCRLYFRSNHSLEDEIMIFMCRVCGSVAFKRVMRSQTGPSTSGVASVPVAQDSSEQPGFRNLFSLKKEHSAQDSTTRAEISTGPSTSGVASVPVAQDSSEQRGLRNLFSLKKEHSAQDSTTRAEISGPAKAGANSTQGDPTSARTREKLAGDMEKNVATPSKSRRKSVSPCESPAKKRRLTGTSTSAAPSTSRVATAPFAPDYSEHHRLEIAVLDGMKDMEQFFAEYSKTDAEITTGTSTSAAPSTSGVAPDFSEHHILQNMVVNWIKAMTPYLPQCSATDAEITNVSSSSTFGQSSTNTSGRYCELCDCTSSDDFCDICKSGSPCSRCKSKK